MHTLHEEWARRPSIVVLDEWPEEWRYVNAVVMTPIRVLGAEHPTSFAIIGDEKLTEEERSVLDTYIRLKRSGITGGITYRDLTTSMGIDRRTVQKVVKSIADKGIGTYKFKEGFRLNIGKWVLDAEKAKAMGINIKEY
jgi:hypothetical protein